MLINSINFNTYNQNFGYRLPKGLFNDVRNIPNMRCVICNKKMLTSNEVERIVKSFGLSAVKTLKSPDFQMFKSTDIYAHLYELAKKHPAKPLTTLMEKNKPSLHISNKLFSTIYLIADKQNLPAGVSIKKIKKYYNLISPQNQKIINELDKYAEKYPDLTFAEIFNKNRIYNYHLNKYITSIKNNRINSKKLMYRIRKTANRLPVQEEQEVLQILQKLNKILLNYYSKSDEATNYIIYSSFYTLAHTSMYKNTIDKIRKNAIKLPRKKRDIHAFVVHCVENNTDDKSMFKFILQDALSSFEHIQLKSKSGSRDKHNGLYDHRHCNNEGGNINLEMRINKDTSIAQHITNQCNKILTLLRTGHLEGYDSFPQIQDTLKTQTKGLVTINLKRFYTEKIKSQRNLIKTTREQINSKTSELEDILSQQNCTRNKLSPHRKHALKVAKAHIQNEINFLNSCIARANDTINEFKEKIKNL